MPESSRERRQGSGVKRKHEASQVLCSRPHNPSETLIIQCARSKPFGSPAPCLRLARLVAEASLRQTTPCYNRVASTKLALEASSDCSVTRRTLRASSGTSPSGGRRTRPRAAGPERPGPAPAGTPDAVFLRMLGAAHACPGPGPCRPESTWTSPGARGHVLRSVRVPWSGLLLGDIHARTHSTVQTYTRDTATPRSSGVRNSLSRAHCREPTASRAACWRSDLAAAAGSKLDSA